MTAVIKLSVPVSSAAERRAAIAQFMRRDKTPALILLLAAIVGTLTGLVGVAFERTVNWVIQQRMALLAHFPESGVSWLVAAAVSAVLAMWGYFLVRRFAPEAGGSGIPEIEGALEELRPVRWWCVLPVKFFGGIGTLGSGMVLGREGPTVQLGGNIGGMVADMLPKRQQDGRHSLLATGAAAGLSAAFNAPLAGILFIIEEMRPQFRYSLISIKAVFIGVIMSSIVFRFFNGEQAVIDVGQLPSAPLKTLWLYLVLGIIFGVVGVVFNALVLRTQALFLAFHGKRMSRFLLVGALAGGLCGVLSVVFHEATGGGFTLIPLAAAEHYSISMLFGIFMIRVFMTLLCFGSGAPGGIFAPMLALGTLLGAAFGMAASQLFPDYAIGASTFAVAGMGALFAASVRAPLTGIVLVLEMTDNYQLILPMIVTCLGATLLAQFLGGKPLYSSILARTLQRQALAEQEQQINSTISVKS
ncbi:H(+)/Cl(-) exchange transporter ClcA [Pectobacterium brasiliense]|uniref:H(+)/Cl(-) exchange transporter ClcA n=1 Tax=Pectobacterium brasiliense TaxID=180957 RepID=UPI000CE69541|nr:H(+)/Cl(-) exchange transporter ClcA [Pectobacterium brasiliense]MBN3180343.1 H(+)/Cl(-) exchange transporter ClcA [Pectobacterium brasiliense]PPE63922.1 H(+)/Cl(-) exchange transporter ClcA [Pectobacterium brasiliense]